jgi:hypothetical protein
MVSFYMWNLTNPEAARNKSLGIKPNYVSVGPFVYQRYRTKENVSFIEDGDLAVYQEATYAYPRYSLKCFLVVDSYLVSKCKHRINDFWILKTCINRFELRHCNVEIISSSSAWIE